MVEELQQQCPIDNHNYNKKRDGENDFSHALDFDYEDRWRTSTQDAFSVPESDKFPSIGRRRDLIRTFVNERVLQKMENDRNPKEVVDDSINPSEYNNQFCDSNFIPFMDLVETDINKLMKYPLYAVNNQTFYKEQVERGVLKLRSEISNLNEPFRKNCAFTTSPDDAFREPTGGY